MIARSVRSGLVEASFDGSAIAVTADGDVLEVLGDPDTVTYYRSSIKPIQATVSQEVGGALDPELLAVACASHGGLPLHVSLARAILDEAGLDEAHLRCPPSWPLSPHAQRLLWSAGHRHERRIFHNCSGKHAAMLRACVAAGWPLDRYLDAAHPLQILIADAVAEVTGVDPAPAGIDGCGAPAFRGTVRGLATAFARISEWDRYASVADATHRYPSIVADNQRRDGRLGAWWDGPLKIGAEGIIGAGRRGVGIAVKSTSGSDIAAVVGIIEMMRRLGMLSAAALHALSDVASPAVLGAGLPVGAVVAAFDVDV